jgi:hypothetical protein
MQPMKQKLIISKRMSLSRKEEQASTASDGQPVDSPTPAAVQGQQLSMPGHAVHFYEDETFLIDVVKAFVMEGIRANEQVVLFVTAEHQLALKRALEEERHDTGDLSERTTAVQYVDAGYVLATVMVNEWPDEALFMATVGACFSSVSPERPLRVFGEMVALLWAQHKHRAALRLEELWNKLIEQQPLSLLCAYCITGFHGKTSCESYRQVCSLHRHVHITEKAA